MSPPNRHRTRIGKRNQVTIPAATLRRLGVGPGDHIDIVDEDGTVRIEPLNDWIKRTAGMLRYPGMPVLSDEQLDLEIERAREEAATARYRRSLPPGHAQGENGNR